MLWRALKHLPTGYYVDIGAHDPEVDSVSLAFYQRGWQGVHVDAALACASRLRVARPDETVIHAALGEHEGVLEFFSFQDKGVELGISCGDAEIAQRHEQAGHRATRTIVPCLTLDGLLHGLGERDIHWLKIDVEGMERKVLQGWRTSLLRPWVVVIESTLPASPVQSHSAWEPLILEKGYECVYFDGLNRFYLSKAHPELRGSFDHPPCVYDHFCLSGQASHAFHLELNDRLAVLMDKLGTLGGERDKERMTEREATDRLQQELHRMQKELAERNARLAMETERVATLKSQLDTISAEHNEDKTARREEVRILHVFNEELIRTRVALQAEIERLREYSRLQSNELQRLQRLLYSASAGQHLFRAWRVLRRDPHYRRGSVPVVSPLKRYSRMQVSWHTHLYRAGLGLFVRGEKPWHTHLYRAWHSWQGDPRYRRIDALGHAQITVIADMLSPQHASERRFNERRANSGV